MTPLEQAIIRAVVYAGLFDYPLAIDQLVDTVAGVPTTRDEVWATFVESGAVQRVVGYRDGFFFPAGRADLIAERRRREARSRLFLDQHRALLRLMCAMPFTRLVALSGSVAHLNLEDGGDIDLFLIVAGHRVWTVTLGTIVMTKLLGLRRVACANFVMSDTQLALDQADLFTANQVVHLQPLSDDGTLAAFRQANPFVAQIYPNARSRAFEVTIASSRWPRMMTRGIELALMPFSAPLEALCRRVYGWHLRRRSASWRSPDQVRMRDDYLKLHTQSHRQRVTERFEREAAAALRDAASETLAVASSRS